MMRELGAILREEREARGLSLEEVHETTHISLKYLAAIEAGDFDALPGEVYRRGFLRSFAEVVGVDSAEVLGRYAELHAADEARAASAGGRAPSVARSGQDTGDGASRTARSWVREPAGRGATDSVHSGLRLWAAIVVSLTVLGGAFVVARWDGKNGQEGKSQVVRRDVAGRAQVGSAPEAPKDAGGAATPEPAVGDAGSGSTTAGRGSFPPGGAVDGSRVEVSLQPLPVVATASGEKPAEARATGTASTAPSKSSSAPTVPEAVPTSGTLSAARATDEGGERVVPVNVKGSDGLSVAATAVQRCWFEVVADGKVIFSRTLEQGQSAVWRGLREVKVRVGNAPGAKVRVNGLDVGDLGLRSLTLVFRRAGQTGREDATVTGKQPEPPKKEPTAKPEAGQAAQPAKPVRNSASKPAEAGAASSASAEAGGQANSRETPAQPSTSPRPIGAEKAPSQGGGADADAAAGSGNGSGSGSSATSANSANSGSSDAWDAKSVDAPGQSSGQGNQ